MSVGRKRFVAGLIALGFVVVTLVAWWLFASLAETVVNCVPWKYEGCEPQFTDRPRLATAIRVSLLLVSLLAAIWVANRMFYTADTYEPKADAAGGSK